MNKRLILILFTLASAAQFVHALDKCSLYLGSWDHFAKMRTRLSQTTGVPVLEPIERPDRPVGAGFDPNNRVVVLPHRTDPILHQIYLHHETVHVTGEDKFLKYPTPQSAALRIQFSREGRDLSPRLLRDYRRGFTLEEIKAFYKTALYLRAIAKFHKENGLPNADHYAAQAKENLEHALVFAEVTYRILNQWILGLETNQDFNVRAHRYNARYPHHYWIHATLPGFRKYPIDISVPVLATGDKLNLALTFDALEAASEIACYYINLIYEMMSRDASSEDLPSASSGRILSSD